MIDIELNGAAFQIAAGSSLQQLIAALALENQALALAVNRQVVRRERWPAQQLQAGDKVDVVRAIGGG